MLSQSNDRRSGSGFAIDIGPYFAAIRRTENLSPAADDTRGIHPIDASTGSDKTIDLFWREIHRLPDLGAIIGLEDHVIHRPSIYVRCAAKLFGLFSISLALEKGNRKDIRLSELALFIDKGLLGAKLCPPSSERQTLPG